MKVYLYIYNRTAWKVIHIRYNPSDLRYIYLQGDSKELSLLEKHLNKIPDYMFLPAYKGQQRPEVFLNKFRANGQTVYWAFAGLWKTIYDWCKANSVDVDGIDNFFKYTSAVPPYDDFCNYVADWNLNLNPREYQLKSAWMILNYRQSLSQLATRSGKTLIAYIVFRWMLEHGAHNILMIVPNTTLVKQGVDDMRDFKEFFTTETVWAGSELCDSSNLTIGTFQSLVKRVDKKSTKYDPDFLNKFDVVCCDEAHTAKCSSIKTILSQPFMKNLKLRFGFTGTLPKEGTIERYTCESLLGPKIQDITSRELMDQGFISDIDVTQILIDYPETDQLLDREIRCAEYLCSEYLYDGTGDNKKKILLPPERREFTIQHEKRLPVPVQDVRCEKLLTGDRKGYFDFLYDICKGVGSNALLLEQMLVHRSEERLAVIETLLKHFNKNSIVFAHHTEYLNYLYKYFKERFPDRPVYIITGSTSVKKRDTIKRQLETDHDAILFASYSCIGTGLTLKNLDYGVFAQSFKSDIINKQSLGRGLMLAQDKDKYRLYDIVDKFPTKRLYVQGRLKNKLFKDEKFDCSVINSKYLDSYLWKQIPATQKCSI